MLPAYWIFLFCCTHFPGLKLDLMPNSDKYAHFLAFGLLAYLFWRFAETLRRPLSGRFVWIAGATLVAYAAIDEYLQQFVNRHVDWRDWACNSTGIVLTLAGLELWRRRAARGATLPPKRHGRERAGLEEGHGG